MFNPGEGDRQSLRDVVSHIGDFALNIGKHGDNRTCESVEAADHGDDDERADQPIFYECTAAFVLHQIANWSHIYPLSRPHSRGW